MPADSPRPAPTAAPAWSERLWPTPWGWGFLVAFSLVLGIVLLPVDQTLALVVAAVAVVAGLGAAVVLTPTVAVADGELRAGRASIPLALLGAVTVLDRQELRGELGPRLDARAHVCLRAWIPSAVRVELTDPEDPTPYWIVSTRRPDELAHAIAAGAAHR